MLELIIGPEDGVINSASIPVTWFLDEETLTRLSKYKEPRILFELEYEDGYTIDRVVEKLSDYIAYIPCRRPGLVRISAYIITSTDNFKSQNSNIKKYYLKEYNTSTRYVYNIKYQELNIDFPINNVDDNCDTVRIVERTWSPYSVVIPKGVFGKELSPTLKFIVNRYLEKTPFDECHQRQRIISLLIYRLYPLTIEFLYWELRLILIYSIMWICGWYKLDISRMLTPFGRGQNNIKSILLEESSNVNILKNIYDKLIFKVSNIKNNIIKECVLLYSTSLFVPLIPVIYGIYITLILMLFPTLPNIWILPVLPFILNFLLVSIIAAFSILTSSIGYTLERGSLPIIKSVNSIIKYDGISQFKKSKELNIELLTHNGDSNSIIADIKRIPLKDRSVSLIYSSIKHSICKPMSK